MLKFFITFVFLASFVASNTIHSTDVGLNKSVKNSPTCELCSTVLSIAQTLLENQATEEDILQFFEKELCNRLGSLSTTCVQYVEAYGKTILKNLADKIAPSEICSRIGLCGTNVNPFKEQSKSINVKSGAVCEVCTLVLSAVQNLLEQNKTEVEIIQFIDKELCGRLGSLSSTCSQYLDAYGKTIIYQLAQHVDPSIVCNYLGLCQTQQIDEKPILMPISNSLNCTICKLVFQQVVNILKSNATEEEILGLIENRLCNATGKFSTVCKTIVDAYGPSIINYLASGVDPEKLCELIGMCSSKKVSLSNLVKRDLNQFLVPKQVKNELYCTVCQYAVQFVDLELKKNSTEEAIVQTLDKVCKVAPPALKDECDALVNSYGIYFIQLLAEYADPLKVCQAIKIC